MGGQKPGFCENTSLLIADSVKNPVSLIYGCNNYKANSRVRRPTILANYNYLRSDAPYHDPFPE